MNELGFLTRESVYGVKLKMIQHGMSFGRREFQNLRNSIDDAFHLWGVCGGGSRVSGGDSNGLAPLCGHQMGGELHLVGLGCISRCPQAELAGRTNISDAAAPSTQPLHFKQTPFHRSIPKDVSPLFLFNGATPLKRVDFELI